MQEIYNSLPNENFNGDKILEDISSINSNQVQSLLSLKIIPTMTFTRSEDITAADINMELNIGFNDSMTKEIDYWLADEFETNNSSDESLLNNSYRRPGVTYSDVVIKSSIVEAKEVDFETVVNSTLNTETIADNDLKHKNMERLNGKFNILPFLPLGNISVDESENVYSTLPFMPVPKITENEYKMFDEAIFSKILASAKDSNLNCDICTDTTYLLQNIIKSRKTRAFQEKNLLELQLLSAEQLAKQSVMKRELTNLKHGESGTEQLNLMSQHELLPNYESNSHIHQETQQSYNLSNPIARFSQKPATTYRSFISPLRQRYATCYKPCRNNSNSEIYDTMAHTSQC